MNARRDHLEHVWREAVAGIEGREKNGITNGQFMRLWAEPKQDEIRTRAQGRRPPAASLKRRFSEINGTLRPAAMGAAPQFPPRRRMEDVPYIEWLARGCPEP